MHIASERVATPLLTVPYFDDNVKGRAGVKCTQFRRFRTIIYIESIYIKTLTSVAVWQYLSPGTDVHSRRSVFIRSVAELSVTNLQTALPWSHQLYINTLTLGAVRQCLVPGVDVHLTLFMLIRLLGPVASEIWFDGTVPTLLNYRAGPKLRGISFGCVLLKLYDFIELHTACVLMDNTCAVKCWKKS